MPFLQHDAWQRSQARTGPTPLAAYEDLADPAAEDSVAGFLLIDGSQNALAIFEVVKPDDFTQAPAKAVAEAALWLSSQMLDINPASLSQEMRRTGTYAEVGGAASLTHLQGVAALDLAEAVTACATVRTYAQRRFIYTLGRDMSGAALQLGVPVTDVKELAEIGLLKLNFSPAGTGPERLSELLVRSFAEVEAQSMGAATPGVLSGFYDLDGLTQGFQAADLIILAARPSIGKTSIALNMARHISATGKPVAIYSLEMSKLQIANRLWSTEVEVEGSRLRSGRIAPGEWEPIGQGLSTLSPLPIYIDDAASSTVAAIRSSARRMTAELGQPPVILIDYLQLMDGIGDNQSAALGQITRGLKSLARELETPVVALSQLSRGVESRTNKRPMMSDLRESGAIEQDADLIMMLYREEYYDPDTPDRGIAEVAIVKHRNGPTGTIKLLFEPQFTRFRNLASASPVGVSAVPQPSRSLNGRPTVAPRPSAVMGTLGQALAQAPAAVELAEALTNPEGEATSSQPVPWDADWQRPELGDQL